MAAKYLSYLKEADISKQVIDENTSSHSKIDLFNYNYGKANI